MIRLLTPVGLALVVVLAAFTVRLAGTPVLPATPYNYAAIALPAHLTAGPVTAIDNTPFDNPTTDAGATLGRVLFYDTRLSLNQTVSCASCHRPEHGFSDPVQLSRGFNGGFTDRNSMGLAFARFYQNGHYFWDERAQSLEIQTLMPVQNAVEMGMTVPEMESRLQAASSYGPLFQSAFGTPDASADRVAQALSQFVRSMVAPNSRYDQARIQQGGGPPQGGQPVRPFPGFTAQEQQGAGLFYGRARCVACHTGELLVGTQPRNNGLDATITDVGAGGGRFKAPSLRNIELTGPYMHDGRFATLEQVVEHYDSGVQNSPNLDPILRNPLRLNLTAAERAALVAFMRTLTDPSLGTDPRWSDPFAVTTALPPPATGETLALTVAPNPIRGAATFTATLDQSADAALDVYDATGRLVATLARDAWSPGPHAVYWDASALPPGRYLVRLAADGRTVTRLVTVVE